jgi:hypothetical protein
MAAKSEKAKTNVRRYKSYWANKTRETKRRDLTREGLIRIEKEISHLRRINKKT